MKLIHHRINQSYKLASIPVEDGAEIDVRYHNDDLILHHDPFGHHRENPELLEHFLKNWNHEGPLILNVKTEGIEDKCIELMNQYAVKSWFFLDLSMPYFVKYTNAAKAGSIRGFSTENVAVRFSEFEDEAYALGFAGKAKWMWVDCFNVLPVDFDKVTFFQSQGFKICIVSPELQGHDLSKINVFKEKLRSGFDAVCTKRTDIWSDLR